MGSSIEIHPTNSQEEILTVLAHPEIWPLVAKDEFEPSDASLPMNFNDHYLAITLDSEIIGVSYFKQQPSGVVEFHPSIIPEFRREHKYEAIKKCMAWAFDNGANTLQVTIPNKLERVIKFARNVGFNEIECNDVSTILEAS